MSRGERTKHKLVAYVKRHGKCKKLARTTAGVQYRRRNRARRNDGTRTSLTMPGSAETYMYIYMYIQHIASGELAG